MGILFPNTICGVSEMISNVSIPNGDQKIKVELTVKELIALTGVRFNEQPDLVLEARKKLKHSLEDSMILDKDNYN
jgi:hypothetical protein